MRLPGNQSSGMQGPGLLLRRHQTRNSEVPHARIGYIDVCNSTRIVLNFYNVGFLTVPILMDQSKTTATTTTMTKTTTAPPKLAVQRSSRDHEPQGTHDESKSPDAGDVLDEKSLSSVMELLRDGDWENATKSCEIGFESRKYCGTPGISRNACSQQNCCWDGSEAVTRQPRCFYPIWRTIGKP